MSKLKLIESAINAEDKMITSTEELHDVLLAKMQGENAIFILELAGYGRLTIGLGKTQGFVEYMSDAGDPPYLIARNDDPIGEPGSYMDFDAGGTPSPIPLENCLPAAEVVQIAQYFLENQSLPRDVVWVEE